MARRTHTCTNFAERVNFNYVCVYGEGQGQGVRDLDDLYRSNSAHKPKLMPDFGSLEKKNDVWAWLAIVACFSVGVCG